MQPAYHNQGPLSPADMEGGDHPDTSKFIRKKSLVKPDREKIEPGHRQWHYRSHVAEAQHDGSGRVGVMPSSEHHHPHADDAS